MARKKKDVVERLKEGKMPRGMTLKEGCGIIKESMKDNADPIAFTDEFEDKLREKLFEEEIEEIKKNKKDKELNPDFESAGYRTEAVKRSGLWDYLRDDDIEFFDPLCSYELTGYKPINDK